MKSDLSRNTFDPALHYSSVRLQQGRVITDADWNEQADLTRYRAEREALDVIGACGAPVAAPGFALQAATYVLAAQARGGGVAWIAGEDGALLQTTNGGADWRLHRIDVAADLRALRLSGSAGWVAGDDGVVARTTDDGATWTLQQSGVHGALRAIAVFDADHAWLAGDGGLVLRTSDGGASWQGAQAGTAHLHAVHFLDLLHGLAVGDGGAILASADGGATWTAQANAAARDLRALSFVDAVDGWAAGDAGTLLHTTDGGATWTDQSDASLGALHAVAFRSASEGYVAGADGLLARTADGGATWTIQATEARATLRALALPADGAAWAAGDASAVVQAAPAAPGEPAVVLPAASLWLQAGRCYVDGVLCELGRRTSYARQAFGKPLPRLDPGGYLLYLKAWQRDVSCIEAPPIREVALGGPDTATRAQTMCQVGALRVDVDGARCDVVLPEWDALVRRPSGRLAARSVPQAAAANLCQIAAAAGYRRLENQLYRVEIHDAEHIPGFKWSRENGSVAYAVLAVAPDTATNETVVRLAARGRDANLDLAPHDLVELIDDGAVAERRAGELFEYLRDGDDELEIVLGGVPLRAGLGADPARHPLLRRWDQPLSTPFDIRVDAAWTDLEDGIQVRFDPAGGSFRPGDYWQIPARTATGDVEWPRGDDGQPLALPPAGIDDRYCRLGLVEVDDTGRITVREDCLVRFAPLTALRELDYVSGDGQQGPAGQVLAHPLEVRVTGAAGGWPRVPVQFTVEEGGGALVGDNPALTDAFGIASVQWRLGADPGQRVRAGLAGADGKVLQRISFNANLAGGRGPVAAGCEVTVGPGGQVAALTSPELLRLLAEAGQVCLCLMPGVHEIDGLLLDSRGALSIHGCGAGSVLAVKGPLQLRGLGSLHLADLVLQMNGDFGIDLSRNVEVTLSNLLLRAAGAPQALVRVAEAERVCMTGCVVDSAPERVAVHFGLIRGDCHVARNRFGGIASFYDEPSGPLEPGMLVGLVNLMAGGRLALRPAPRSSLFFADNNVAALGVGKQVLLAMQAHAMAEVFETVAMHGNTITAASSLFASNFISFSGNSFSSEPPEGVLYGAFVANRASAVGNLAAAAGENPLLRFLTGAGGFSEAANQMAIGT
jgi:photosystem II stability/assembly factor-like uncharacterized protein